MKFCSKCGAQCEDNTVFCPACGNSFNGAATVNNAANYDHTNEFDEKDVSEGKVYAMLCYLLGVFGIIIALLASAKSEYISFHVRQALKITVTSILVGLCTALLCWTIIVPIAGFVCLGILSVIKIIAFFQICAGKSKEPAIVRSLGFLK